MFAVFLSDRMDPFYEIVLGFPTVIYSGLLLVVLVYWLSMALGLVDLDALDFEAPEAHLVGGLLLKLGLNHVPLTVIISFLALIAWTISFFSAFYLFPLVPDGALELLVGVLLFFLTAFVAAWITAWLIRPTRPFFRAMNQEVSVELIGRTAVVRTGEVNSGFGEVCVDDGGAGLIIAVRAYEGETFQRGDRVVLIEKIDNSGAYRVVSEAELRA